jgi:hypothetical protein
MIENIQYYWHRFRYWLASKIVGMDIIKEVDAAYEAGRQWGKTEAFKWNTQ